MSTAELGDRLTLRCGLTLANRLARAAMTEGLSGPGNDPCEAHERLYRANAAGGAGLVLTGNVMVDRRHLERARNIVIDSASDMAALRRWAQSASQTPTLVQISHPGRQTSRAVQAHPVAPSAGPAVALAGMYARPRALSAEEIDDVRERFIAVGVAVVDAGFAGVQVHAAHGYLLSSFLNAALNHREDGYGGPLHARARLLLEIVSGLRDALPPGAAVSVKLNSGDGADDELAELAMMLEGAGADLLEISGGSYESSAMLGFDARGRELQGEHESPFWNSAAAVSAAVSETAVMLTGGFRTRSEVDLALAGGVCSMVGVGRPLAVRPDLAGRFVRGESDVLDRPAPRLSGPAALVQMLGPASGAGWHRIQMARTAKEQGPALRLPALAAALDYALVDGVQALSARRSRMRICQTATAVARPPVSVS